MDPRKHFGQYFHVVLLILSPIFLALSLRTQVDEAVAIKFHSLMVMICLMSYVYCFRYCQKELGWFTDNKEN